MPRLTVNVANKVATYAGRGGKVVCGNSDYEIAFNFDSEWDAHDAKTARFVWGGKFYDQDFTGNVCPVPVIRDAQEFTVGVYAGDLRTTTPAKVPCARSILCANLPAQPEAERDFASEAQKAAAEAKEAAAEAQEAADISAEILAKNEQMRDMPAEVVRGEANGASATLVPVSPIEHTVHVKVESRNLIPYPFTETTKTEDGVKFTDNGDGTVTLTGTHGGMSPVFTLGVITIKESGNYFLSGCPEGGGYSSYALIASDARIGMTLDVGSGASFYAYAGEVFEVSVNVTGAPVGATFNVTFKPQLEVGEAATAFAPSASGAPVVASGKNLFDPSAERGKVGVYTGIDITHIAKVFGKNLWLSLKLKEGKSVPQVYFGFAFTLENANPTANWVLTPTGGVVEKGLKIPNWYDQVGVCAYGANGITGPQAFEFVLDAFDVQLEVGATKTEYVPFSFYEEYTAAENGVVDIPSRSPYMLIAPKATGLTVSATYNRDLAKAITLIEKALAELGVTFDTLLGV